VTFLVSSAEIDLVRSVTCGQLFRFWCLPDGIWEGVEGEQWFRFKFQGSSYEVETNGSEESFRRLFRLDESEAELELALRDDAELYRLFQRHRRVRLARPSDPVEALFSFLCSSNNHLTRIGSMVRSLASFGVPLTGFSAQKFPKIARLAQVEEAELRHLRFGYRAKSITEFAQRLHEQGGEVHLSAIGQRSYSDKISALLTYPGVGNKLADCISLYAFGDCQAVPIDVHVWRISTQILCPQWCGKNLTPSRYQSLGNYYRERFGQYAARVQQLLFLESLSR
jgi:N-glycosylase/DNA lyase